MYVIKCGLASKEIMQDILNEIECKMPDVEWATGAKPSLWNPRKIHINASDTEYHIVLFIDDDNVMTYTEDSEECIDQYITLHYGKELVIGAKDFLGTDEIENETDVSFLFN